MEMNFEIKTEPIRRFGSQRVAAAAVKMTSHKLSFRQRPGDIHDQLESIKTETDLETLKLIIDKVPTVDVKKAARIRFYEVSVLEGWADRVNSHYADAVGSIIAAGNALIDAKKELPRGHWQRLFAGHPDAVRNPVRFTVNTAQRLMAIARHPGLSNAAHAQFLPASWATLYQLRKLDALTLERAIAEGRVHPAMQRADVRNLMKGEAAPRTTKRSTVENAVRCELEDAGIPDGHIALVQSVIRRMLTDFAHSLRGLPDGTWQSLVTGAHPVRLAALDSSSINQISESRSALLEG